VTRRVLAAALAAGAALGWAWPVYRDGPPPAHTGGFGEPLCNECHFGAPLNDSTGTLTIEAPSVYEPGHAYRLVVRLDQPAMEVAGFQLAVRFADGKRSGTQAGVVSPGDDRTTVTADTATGVAYGHHAVSGTALTAPGTARWAVEWVAPTGDDAVVVHVAANAANDDASEFGDLVYATSRRIQPAPASRQSRTRGTSQVR
jgi:hypothetical protein